MICSFPSFVFEDGKFYFLAGNKFSKFMENPKKTQKTHFFKKLHRNYTKKCKKMVGK